MKPQPAPPLTRRAVLYLRQSTYREESISLELQESAGREYAARNGYQVVDVLADPGISGRTWKRPAVQRVMEMLEQDEADTVVLWRWSRLSRSRKDWALAADRADLAGGRIESATEPNDPTAAGRFARGMMTEMAAFESERIGEQWKETHDRRRRLGLTAEGGPRFGYIKQGDGSYELHPTQSIILRDMYRRYLNGEGFTSIARRLNAEGHPTNAGGLWSRISVTQVLDAGFGAGKIIHRPGRRSMKPGDCTYHPGAHTAVIQDEEWSEYLAKRADAPAPPQVTAPKYFLTGLIFCECGAAMHVGNRGLADYKCSAKSQGSAERGMVMKRSLVEQKVREWVFERASDIDALAKAEAAASERRIRAVASQTTNKARVKKIDQTLGKLTVAWLNEELPQSAYKATVSKLDAERATLTARPTYDDRRAQREVDVRRLAMSLRDRWDDLTVLEKRNLLRELISRVTIVPPVRQGTGVWRERVKIEEAWDDPAV